jgi:hypothetical protein
MYITGARHSFFRHENHFFKLPSVCEISFDGLACLLSCSLKRIIEKSSGYQKSSFSSHPLQHLIANTFSTLFENFERKECCLIIFPLRFTGKQFWLSPAGMPDGSFSNVKSQFSKILEGLRFENVDML